MPIIHVVTPAIPISNLLMNPHDPPSSVGIPRSALDTTHFVMDMCLAMSLKPEDSMANLTSWDCL